MHQIKSNSVRFLKLHLHNYGKFRGYHDFVFDPRRTLIIGEGGMGKTTIINALKYLGPAPGMKPHSCDESGDMSAEVITSGNRDLIKIFRHIVFLDCESAQQLARKQEKNFAGILDDEQKEMTRLELRKVFDVLIQERSLPTKKHKNLSTETMTIGERVCLGYAYAFAIRKVLNLDLPIVFDSPYSALDSILRKTLRTFLKKQACQQILLGIESEFLKEDKQHYKANRRGGLYCHVHFTALLEAVILQVMASHTR